MKNSAEIAKIILIECYFLLRLPDLLKVSAYLREGDIESKIVGVGSVESSFLVQCCRSVDSYTDPDFAPILVFMECLTTLEVNLVT